MQSYFRLCSVADPKLKFRIRIRPAVLNPDSHPGCGSGSESWIWIRIPDPDQKLAKTSSFCNKILRSLIFKHKKSAIPQLRDLASNKLRNKFSIYVDLAHYAFCICIVFPPMAVNLWLHRRKIRLIEGKAKCHLKKMACKGILRQVFICLRPRTLNPPPPYTKY
jgi:hypothetical protein